MSGYESQQQAHLQTLIAYLQDKNNWTDGMPKLTDFTPGSVVYTLLSAIATAFDTISMSIYTARQAAYLSTATGTDLDAQATDFGIIRKPAQAAQATFTFTKISKSNADIPIPAGSLVSTFPDPGGNVITFVTTDIDAKLPAGTLEVDVKATCQTAGAAGNITANTRILISSAIPGIDGVLLKANATLGVDLESDDSLRARALGSFAALARGTEAWYQQTALAVPGVYSAKVVPQNRGAGTVDVFITGPNNSVPSLEVQQEVQARLDETRPCTDNVKQQAPAGLMINAAINIKVLAGYNPVTTCTAVQTAVINYISKLGVGAGELGYVYLSAITAVVMSTLGVANATVSFTDTPVDSDQLPQATTNSITVTSS